MRKRDTSDVLAATVAVIADALAVFGGYLLAAWIRFDSGWILLRHSRPLDTYALYAKGAVVMAVIFLLVFRSLQLYERPQTGRFTGKIPRLIRATGIGIMLSMVGAFAVQNTLDYSRIVIGVALGTVTGLVLLERYLLFRIEWNLARHSKGMNRVLILGTDAVAAHVEATLRREPMLRSQVTGFLRTDGTPPDAAINPGRILGSVQDLGGIVAADGVDQVILTDAGIGHNSVVEIILLCERNLVVFNMVPDLFRIMTSNMDVQSLDDIPLLGISRWPLDYFWNRMLKRIEDVLGSMFGLLVAGPVVAVAMVLIRLESPGQVFYRQERCGESGQRFTLFKLRTMRVDAEAMSGPVFTVENDPRRTRVGGWLRKHNIDELPQLWNVLLGHMSLVGPRPERPVFVEQFKEEISRYMWRHVSKPGLTGWAQVNGLRGNTSIEERVKYDLYYLENWSLSFDFKILLKTFFAKENAY